MFRAKRGERGSVLVEGAITLLLFLSLVFGIIGIGWAVYVYNEVSELAREGTRYAIVHGAKGAPPASITDIQNYVLARASGLNPKDLTVTVNPTWPTNNKAGDVVTVQVRYSLTPFLPLIPQEVLSLQSTSQMQGERLEHGSEQIRLLAHETRDVEVHLTQRYPTTINLAGMQ